MLKYGITRSDYKSAENVGWDVVFAQVMFNGGIVILNIKFPLLYLAWAVVVKKQEVPVVRTNGKWDSAYEVIKA